MKFQWISFSIAMLLFGFAAGATTLDSYMRNREGLQQFEKKSYNMAYRSFVKALENDPLNPEVQLNIARALEAGEDYTKAEKAYNSVLQMLPAGSERRFQVYFNLGNVQSKAKKIDDALASYQAALAIDPDSKEVKHNIELLWQSGGGGDGEGDPDKKEQGEGKGKSQGDPQNQPEKPQQQKFQSKDLTQEDVKKILDEIKNQEQSIRAQENDKGAKESARGKDW